MEKRIGTFTGEDGLQYHVQIWKLGIEDDAPMDYVGAVGFDIYLPRRTLRKMGRDRTGAYTTLNKTFNLATMRKIEGIIRTYLDTEKPPYLAVNAYNDEYREKRMKLYVARLKTMGYEIIGIWRDAYYEICYIMGRRNTDDN